MPRDTHRLGTKLTVPSLLALAVLAGCGGASKDESGPWDDFVGRWQLSDGSTTAFMLTCGTTAQPYVQWVELVFEHGSVTDLTETSGLIRPDFGCTPALAYDVIGDTATIVNPDPYVGGAPFCDALAFDNMGNAVALLEFEPGAEWAFVLQPKVAGKPPEGVLKGAATVTPFVPDATTGMLMPQAACAYTSGTGGDRFFRLSQP